MYINKRILSNLSECGIIVNVLLHLIDCLLKERGIWAVRIVWDIIGINKEANQFISRLYYSFFNVLLFWF